MYIRLLRIFYVPLTSEIAKIRDQVSVIRMACTWVLSFKSS